MKTDDTRPENDAPDQPSIEHDPTLAWEPPVQRVDGDGATSQVEGAFAWALTVETGPRAGLTYVLGPGNTIAGRGGDAAIFLADVTVSREHARFSVDANGLSVSDLGSTNGIYINDERMDAAKLNEGDGLLIGKFHLRVSRGHG